MGARSGSLCPWLKPRPWSPGAQGPSCPLSQAPHLQLSQVQPARPACSLGTLCPSHPSPGCPTALQGEALACIRGPDTPPTLQGPCSGQSPRSRSRAACSAVGTTGRVCWQPVHHTCTQSGPSLRRHSDLGSAIFLLAVTAEINRPCPVHCGQQAVAGKVGTNRGQHCQATEPTRSWAAGV